MVDDGWIQLIDPTIAPVSVGNVVPGRCAVVTDRPIVLGSGYKPFPSIRVGREIFDLGNAKALVESFPARTAVGGAEGAAVITRINNLRPIGREGQTVLIRMDAVGSLRGDVGPSPPGARKVPTDRVDGT